MRIRLDGGIDAVCLFIFLTLLDSSVRFYNPTFLVFLCKKTKNTRILKQFYLFALGVLFLISSITTNVARASDEFYALLHELKTNNLGRWEASRTVLRNYAANYNIAVDSLRADSDSTYTYSLARLVLAQALHEQGDYSSSTQLCNGAINISMMGRTLFTLLQVLCYRVPISFN